MDQLIIKGYCVLTITISGYELSWRTEEEVDGKWISSPEIYPTERDAQLAIIEDIEEDIQQFKDDDRDFDEIHQFGEYLVSEIEIKGDSMIVWETGNKFNNKIIETTLEQWRKAL